MNLLRKNRLVVDSISNCKKLTQLVQLIILREIVSQNQEEMRKNIVTVNELICKQEDAPGSHQLLPHPSQEMR